MKENNENIATDGAVCQGNVLDDVTRGDYKYGFTSDIDTEIIPRGLTEDTVRFISERKGEPEWLLEFRLKAFRHWLGMTP